MKGGPTDDTNGLLLSTSTLSGRALGRERKGRWMIAMDMEECKTQVVLAAPMALTNVFYYMIPLVSVMFAGHLGQLELAGCTLANSWATVTGFAFMTGLSGALETLCGQGYGAQCYKTMGIYLQASCMITFMFSILISILWWYTEPILVSLHQSPEISKQAAIYMRCLIPGILAFGILQNILRFLTTQSVVFPLLFCSVVPLFLHIILVYVLVNSTTLGYKGAALATSFTFWVSLLMLVLYVNYAGRFGHTWTGFSWKSFDYLLTNLKLALPSAAMVCLEESAFEFLVLLAGLMPNAESSTSIIAMCVNTETITYNFGYGLSAATSTRVSNELGALRPHRAKHAMHVTLTLSILLTFVVILALLYGHEIWAGLFSDNTNIIEGFSSVTPLLCVSIFLDSIQGVLSGVSRGCGWQHLIMFINLGTFYGIGMPMTWLFAFKLAFNTKGLWLGLICGLASQSVFLFLLSYFKKWSALECSTNETEISALLQMVSA